MKRSSLLCLPVFAALLPLTVSAATLWEGTVGKAAVVVLLDSSNPSSGSYFYRRHLLDIQLSDEGGMLKEGFSDDAGPQWKMSAATSDTWEGVWVGTDGRQLPIRLHALPVAVSADKAHSVVGEAYEQQRRRDLILKPGARETRGGIAVQWWSESRSKVRWPQVVSGYPDAVRTRINDTLRKRQWAEIGSYFDCMSSPRGGEYDQTVTLRYVAADALSMSVFTSYDCGGAHPDFGDNPITFDGRTGEQLGLEDILYVGRGKPPVKTVAGDSPELDKYHTEVLSPWLRRTMLNLYPQAKPAKGEDEGCNYGDPSVWNYVSWYLTPKGVYVGPSFARVARACEYPDWSVIPWRIVREHAGQVKVGPGAAK